MQTKTVSEGVIKLEKLQREKDDVAKQFSIEMQKSRDVEKNQAMLAMQFEQEKDMIKTQTIETCKDHVLKGLVQFLAEKWRASSLTVDNMPPEAHPWFFDAIDGKITWGQLEAQMMAYYQQHPDELAKIGVPEMTSGQSTSDPIHAIQPVQAPQSTDPPLALPISSNVQQPSGNVYIKAGFTNHTSNYNKLPGEDMVIEPTHAIEERSPVQTLPQQTQNFSRTPLSTTQQPFSTAVGFKTADPMTVDSTKQKSRPCKFINLRGGCKNGQNCSFSHDQAVTTTQSPITPGYGQVFRNPSWTPKPVPQQQPGTEDPMVVDGNTRLVCKFFNKPSGCKNGANCSFVDEQATNVVVNTPAATNQAMGYQPQSSTGFGGNTQHSKQVCKFFNTRDGCKNGESCKFAHGQVAGGGSDGLTDPMIEDTPLPQPSASQAGTGPTQTPLQNRTCRYASLPGGCTRQGCPFIHPTGPSTPQGPSKFGIRTNMAEPGSLRVETFTQRPLCRSILARSGCNNLNRKGFCDFSHPGDPDCRLSSDAVAILQSELEPAISAIHEASEDEHSQACGHGVRTLLNFVDRMIASAREASLTRENKIILLELMNSHVNNQTLRQLIKSSTPQIVSSWNLPGNAFSAAADSIDGWFGAGSDISQQATKCWDTLKHYGQQISKKLVAARRTPGSYQTAAPPRPPTNPAHADPASRLNNSLQDIIDSARASQQQPQGNHNRSYPNGQPFGSRLSGGRNFR